MTAAAVPTAWTTGTTEVFRTGTWRAALPQHIHAPSPCHLACPVNGDIAEWIGRARDGDLRGAWEILTRHNPFPAIAGRICHHPCEAACNRAFMDEPLAICALERHVGDAALANDWSFAPPTSSRAEHVGIVGGGPSGLSAAFHLRRLGYGVTLYEAKAELGGVMRYGIPPYRLPRSVLDGEIARVVALGVDVRMGETLREPGAVEHLREMFDAVYLATGATRSKRLQALDYSRPWVVDGAEYLAAINTGHKRHVGKRVVVIGGGSAAMDVARSARRHGHEVTVLALESLEEMPAQRDEIEEALEEGVRILDGAMLSEAIDAGDTGVVLQCVRVRFEPGPTRDSFKVTPLADKAFWVTTDAVISAIGQDPDLAPMRDALAIDGPLVHAERDQRTNRERVYAGGDLASTARFVTEAVAAGKRAALAIDHVFRGAENDAGKSEAVVPYGAISTFHHEKHARVKQARASPARRLSTGCEASPGLGAADALVEMHRCFSCGSCIHCDNCVEYCPDLAVKPADGGYVVLTDYCKGCGVCVKECPTGSMKMIEALR